LAASSKVKSAVRLSIASGNCSAETRLSLASVRVPATKLKPMEARYPATRIVTPRRIFFSILRERNMADRASVNPSERESRGAAVDKHRRARSVI
jgi:hypothetical protein